MMAGEVDLIREQAMPYCKGHGLDLGCGYNKITPEAWGMDRPDPYTKLGDDTIELQGDAQDLRFIRDQTLDYIFSSHLLEDFMCPALTMHEWVSKLKLGGYLILYLPDQKYYEEHSLKSGGKPNPSHRIKDMSLKYIKDRVMDWPWVEIVEEIEHHADYSFFIVLRKVQNDR